MCPKATHFLVREKGSESARQSSAVELGEAGEPAHLPGLQIAADLAAEQGGEERECDGQLHCVLNRA